MIAECSFNILILMMIFTFSEETGRSVHREAPASQSVIVDQIMPSCAPSAPAWVGRTTLFASGGTMTGRGHGGATTPRSGWARCCRAANWMCTRPRGRATAGAYPGRSVGHEPAAYMTLKRAMSPARRHVSATETAAPMGSILMSFHVQHLGCPHLAIRPNSAMVSATLRDKASLWSP